MIIYLMFAKPTNSNMAGMVMDATIQLQLPYEVELSVSAQLFQIFGAEPDIHRVQSKGQFGLLAPVRCSAPSSASDV